MGADVGVVAVQSLVELLHIKLFEGPQDDRAVTWRPHLHAQHLSATAPSTTGNTATCRVEIQTDVLAVSEEVWDQVAEKFDTLSTLATMSHWGWTEGALSLRCAVEVHEDTLGSATQLLKLAAIDQIAEAERIPGEVQSLVPALRGKPAVAEAEQETLRATAGDSNSPAWRASEIDMAIRALNRSGAITTGDEAGLVAEFPYGSSGGPAWLGGTSNVLKMATGEVHPRLGAGLHFRLTLGESPVLRSRRFARPRRLTPTDLNQLDWERQRVSAVGAWCVNPRGGSPVHVGFLPNSAADAGILVSLAQSECSRAQWATSLFPTKSR